MASHCCSQSTLRTVPFVTLPLQRLSACARPMRTVKAPDGWSHPVTLRNNNSNLRTRANAGDWAGTQRNAFVRLPCPANSNESRPGGPWIALVCPLTLQQGWLAAGRLDKPQTTSQTACWPSSSLHATPRPLSVCDPNLDGRQLTCSNPVSYQRQQLPARQYAGPATDGWAGPSMDHGRPQAAPPARIQGRTEGVDGCPYKSKYCRYCRRYSVRM